MSATHQRDLSKSSSRRSGSQRDEREPLTHESSSDDRSSTAPTIFDQRTANAAGVTSPGSAAAEGSEDAWTELRVRFLIDCPIFSFS
jgi:hypothetical protein